MPGRSRLPDGKRSAVKLPPELSGAAADLGARAAKSGQRAAVVGGCVRDAMLGRETRDLDIMIEGDAGALAKECAAAWGAKLETFGRFGTARLLLPGGTRLDLARARAEDYPKPAALPVVRPATMEEDLKRRDFTVNAMARFLTPEGVGEPLDPFGGAKDLTVGCLRVLHDQTFRDDPTRLYRAARYAGRLGLTPDGATAVLIKESVARKDPGLVSRERLRQELWRILEEADPGPALNLCAQWGITEFLYRDFKAPAGLDLVPDALTRLGLITFALGTEADAFVASFPFGRHERTALLSALRAAREKVAPPQPLPEGAVKILHAVLPGLPPSALSGRFLTGADLIKKGFAPGPSLKNVIDEAAAEQWAGRITSASAAEDWFGKRQP